MSNNPPRDGNSNARRAFLLAWMAAGTFDIAAAILYAIYKGGTALGVGRAVASGLLGKRVVGAGWEIGSIGMVLHYLIMFGIVAVFWFASRRFHFLLTRPLIVGPVYGVCVYAVMNLVVLPLSAIVFKPNYAMEPLIVGIITHMVCVGLPIAWLFHQYARDADAGILKP